MFSKIQSCGTFGITGYPVYIECDVGSGLPQFEIVGLGDSAVKEARERVRSAMKNSGFEFPVKRITINLAPANLRKEGSIYDFGIAVGILAATGQIRQSGLGAMMFLGELALDGGLRGIKGVLPMVRAAREAGLKGVMLPERNAGEGRLMGGLHIYAAGTLRQAVDSINGNRLAELRASGGEEAAPGRAGYDVDLADIKGHLYAKRAVEIAASGGHNLLLTGSPGTGKTMLARGLAGILPDMELDEALEVTMIHSVSGLLPGDAPLIRRRPFRNPHFNISASSLVGGGPRPRPGEISLAHNGVLFLDEVAEFSSYALNALRQPLEEREVNISRVAGNVRFPANASIVAATNPCKCGNCFDVTKQCTCTIPQIRQYRSKLSGPLLDRLDILISVPRINYEEISSGAAPENSECVRKRVANTRALQRERYKEIGLDITTNSQLKHDAVAEVCPMTAEARVTLRESFEKTGLSARSYMKVMKVARTIADMERDSVINKTQMSEAIQYRSLENDWSTKF